MKQYILIVLLFPLYIFSQQLDPLLAYDATAQQKWVDSVYGTLSVEEKIGQLFMPRAYSDQGKQHGDLIRKLVEQYKVGGLIFSKGGPVRQANFHNELQQRAKVPLLIGMDAEWGLAMRLDSTHAFPWNMTLGAIKDNALVEEVGKRMGKHAKRLGVHFTFAPVVDINTNPKNPIIGNRSFGEDRENVAEKALALMRGLKSEGVMANAKHFPGHGDTATDSHHTLPTIAFSEQRIDSVELYPYKRLIENQLESVMVAHLNVPSLEARQGYPSSISENIVSKLLKGKLGFNGLIFTDALEMKGVSNFTAPGDVDLAAFMAGNDVLLISEDIPKAIEKIKEAYEKGTITEERLAHSVKKILKAKFKMGLDQYCPVETDELFEDLNTVEDELLQAKAVEHSLTVVKNDSILPIANVERKIAYVRMGDDKGGTFLATLKRYGRVDEVRSNKLEGLLKKLKHYETVIVGLHRSNENPWKAYRFADQEKVWLHQIALQNKVILDAFVKPYALLDLATITNIEGIIISYQNSRLAQQRSAQLIFGAIAGKGQLPVTAHKELPIGTGLTTSTLKRLSYGFPEEAGLDSKRLKRIDTILRSLPRSLITPGGQVLIARRGKVVYHRPFGHHTYMKNRKVRWDDVYDLASLTKILATLPVVMKMEEKKMVHLESRIRDMLPETKNSNKAAITLKDMLSHFGRFKPWIPFYVSTLDSTTSKPSKEYYRSRRSDEFGIQVAKNLFLRSNYKDSIFQRILDSDLRDHKTYKYSDLPYYLLKDYIEKSYRRSLDKVASSQYYRSLGANYTMYNPLGKITADRIVPSEADNYYRFQVIKGFVHDMGAAMQGGIGGHAGLFANANDVAKIMQMYIQKGYYGGKRYLEETTIDKFNKCYFCEQNNRRGVGFDKPQLGDSGPTCGCVSMTSFGHSGFTGTFTWADPDEEIVYVFLSNRTFPDGNNHRLISKDIRSRIQGVIYEAIID